MKPSGRLRVNTKMVHETVDAEVIIIDLDSGTYYSIMGTGADVWRAVERGLTRRQVLDAVAHAYAGDQAAVRPAVDAFLDDLVAHGIVLVDQDAGDDSPAPPSGPASGPFVPPTLTVHDNMADLLTLDPIHDVDERGWPNRGPE
jgi:hypothetical protein